MSSLSLLLLLLSLFSVSLSQLSPPRAILIDCGAKSRSVVGGRQWLPDDGFVFSGTSKSLTTPVLDTTLSTVRSFPLADNLHRKFCYVVPVNRGSRYMIRTLYFYGSINGVGSTPPVFDQIVDGTLWSVVNTTDEYAEGNASYFEGVFLAKTKSMSLCLGVNTYTESDPFISALEFVLLADSVYNATDFQSSALRLVERTAFGYKGSIIRYPNDQFDRFWAPFDVNATAPVNRNLPVSGFWNLPPSRIFDTALRFAQPEPLELTWPTIPLMNSTYYIALYFADDRDSLAGGGSRNFDISINGVTYFRNLSVTHAGTAIFAKRWPLDGLTKIALTPTLGSSVGPIINAGEIFEVMPLGGRTLTRDATALNAVKDSLQNPPVDWYGDPCLPREYSWTGVSCSEGPRIRVITLNLTSMGLSGSLSPNIANLTALSGILLGNNDLSGPIPDLSSLNFLEKVHLDNNKFTGRIPPSFGTMQSLRELYLQNNNLSGQIPNTLIRKTGLDLRTSGNPSLSPPS